MKKTISVACIAILIGLSSLTGSGISTRIPITTQDDLVIGDVNGVPVRLAAPVATGQQYTLQSTGPGFTNWQQIQSTQLGQGGTGSQALNFGSIADGDCAELTWTLTGALTTDLMVPGWPATLETGLYGIMIITATNTVTVRLCNLSGAAVDPASQTFSGRIMRGL